MPPIKKTIMSVTKRPEDDRLRFALYDNQRATEQAAQSSEEFSDKVDELNSIVEGLRTELEMTRDEIKSLVKAIGLLADKIKIR